MPLRGRDRVHVPIEQGFEREAEMAAPVTRWLRQNKLTVKSEFSLPWGICDFVGVMFDAQKVQRRLSYGQTQSIGSLPRLQILSKIPDLESGKSVSLRKLEGEFCEHIPSELFLKEIDSLLRNKFIESPRRGFYCKLNGWAPLHRRIIAVENKLSRFSDAVAQAAANRAFATESYIALPIMLALRVMSDRRRDVLNQAGVGLLAVGRQSCRKVIAPPVDCSKHSEAVQSHVIERFWRTRDSSP
jgi:hypothetical protein